MLTKNSHLFLERIIELRTKDTIYLKFYLSLYYGYLKQWKNIADQSSSLISISLPIILSLSSKYLLINR